MTQNNWLHLHHAWCRQYRVQLKYFKMVWELCSSTWIIAAIDLQKRLVTAFPDLVGRGQRSWDIKWCIKNDMNPDAESWCSVVLCTDMPGESPQHQGYGDRRVASTTSEDKEKWRVLCVGHTQHRHYLSVATPWSSSPAELLIVVYYMAVYLSGKYYYLLRKERNDKIKGKNHFPKARWRQRGKAQLKKKMQMSSWRL